MTSHTNAVGFAGRPDAMESRVYDTHAKQFIAFNTLADRAARADIVFFGEQHDDPATHRAELALLADIGARNDHVVLSLEMIERDVQGILDSYLAGRTTDSVFMATSRPWPNYQNDYRPLVELARAHGWTVVAANVPRRIASTVSKSSLAALDSLSTTDRAYVARENLCPHDRYYDRFAEEMTGHSAGGQPASSRDATAETAMTNRFYDAQCIKDETMGESIAAALSQAGPGAVVVHYNGAFHTDMGLGTAARAKRRAPRAKTVLITAVPVDDVSRVNAAEFNDRADYILFTPKPTRR
jgi:uncharacterized iron-regulated protein